MFPCFTLRFNTHCCIILYIWVTLLFLLRPAGSNDASSTLTQRRARLTQMRRLWAGHGESLLLGDLMVMLGKFTPLLGQIQLQTECVCWFILFVLYLFIQVLSVLVSLQVVLLSFVKTMAWGIKLWWRSGGSEGNLLTQVKCPHAYPLIRAQGCHRSETGHLCSLVSVNAVSPEVGIFVNPQMPPPTEHQVMCLRQIVLAGLGDHLARRVQAEDLLDPKWKNGYKVRCSKDSVWNLEASRVSIFFCFA